MRYFCLDPHRDVRAQHSLGTPDDNPRAKLTLGTPGDHPPDRFSRLLPIIHAIHPVSIPDDNSRARPSSGESEMTDTSRRFSDQYRRVASATETNSRDSRSARHLTPHYRHSFIFCSLPRHVYFQRSPTVFYRDENTRFCHHSRLIFNNPKAKIYLDSEWPIMPRMRDIFFCSVKQNKNRDDIEIMLK